jgi:hypothetical protein
VAEKWHKFAICVQCCTCYFIIVTCYSYLLLQHRSNLLLLLVIKILKLIRYSYKLLFISNMLLFCYFVASESDRINV